MRTTPRVVLTISLLGSFVALVMAADEKKLTTITVKPTIFQREGYSQPIGAISPDGKYVARIPNPKGSAGTELRIQETVSKKVLHTFPVAGIHGTTFTPDSTRLVCLCTQQNAKHRDGSPICQVEIYDVKSGKRLRTIPLKIGQPWGGGDACGTPPFGLSNDIVVVGGTKELATVYDLKTGKDLGDLPSDHRAYHMALSRDGRWLLTMDKKKVMHTWDVKARKHDRKLYEHIKSVRCIAISPDGRWCALGTMRGVKVFDRTTGGEKTEGRIGLAWADAIAFSPDGKRIVASHPYRMPSPDQVDFGLRIWDWQTERPPSTVVCPVTPKMLEAWRHMGRFHARLMSDDGNRFLSVGGEGGHLLLDLKNPNPKPVGEPDEDPMPKKP